MDTTYTIEIEYTTGDSLGQHDTTDTVGCCWMDKSLAQKALQSIKEHHDCYSSITQKSMIKKAKKHEWFSSSEYDKEGKHSLMVEIDDGSFVQISCFWVGYFESLISGSVVVDGDDDNDHFVI